MPVSATRTCGLSIDPYRLLGFAFAAADLLVEVDGADRIQFAVGAADVLSGTDEQALIGRSWPELVDPRDRPLIKALFDGLEGAARRGPVVARRLTPAGGEPQAFALSACRLPQNGGRVSCVFNHASTAGLPATESGLHDRQSFEALTQSMLKSGKEQGLDLELAFIDLPGLAEARKTLAPEQARALDLRLGGALRAQSQGGSAAAELSDERYALVRQAGEAAEMLSGRIARLIAAETGGLALQPAARSLALESEAGNNQVVRAIRYALDDFIKDGMSGDAPADLSDAVARSVKRTLAKADALSNTVLQKNFQLVFQPVVALKTGELHHHEVLVRFGDNASPFPMIRMAEELDLIEDLDLAIAEQSIAIMIRDPAASLAVNISGRTIITDSFMSRMTAMIDGAPLLKGRLMFEITESAAIEDLQLADRHIQALRKRGCQVCLDDFGAGAASLAYLQQLSLDLVKIDGRYVRDLQHGGRESTFIKHLVTMCAELKVRTLAEMIETTSVEDAVRRAGVDYGQGWLYGAAAETLQGPTARPGPSAARRVGSRESWG